MASLIRHVAPWVPASPQFFRRGGLFLPMASYTPNHICSDPENYSFLWFITFMFQELVILIYKMLASVCVRVCVSIHADFSAVLSSFGDFEVLLDLTQQGLADSEFHAISHNFHAILAISAIYGPISTCWVSKCMYSS